MTIYKLEESEELGSENIKDFERLEVDWCVYYYEAGDYEGSGFGLWKKDGKLGYSDFSHCSCYGPTENLSTLYFDSIEDIKKFCNEYNFGQEVVDYAIKNGLV